MNYNTYDEFWLERLSYEPKQKGIYFSREEREWALKQTDYKYFGYYEFDDKQRIAVAILGWCAEYMNKELE